ncbi:MAG TPA: hypothetical protein QF456_02795 [Nitrosopumilus sp.]|jgi:hypothetical protein|nr:hypothetical protein [Nitrosopumilus sp.]HJM79452.1 hypothetical protein [Nitrosopumilus sp.]
MSDSLLDDVNSLLDGDFGDDRILKQIARACKNNEVISNYERNYVQKLAEQYLGKKSEIAPEKIEITNSTISDVNSSKSDSEVLSQSTQREISGKSNSKNSKLFLGLGGIAIVIIVAAVFLLSNNTDSSIPNPISEIKLDLSIQTDLSSYSKTDLISIHGISSDTVIVNLSIINPDNKLVWAEQVSVKNNGKYSTLAIADGDGWENSGTYTVKVENGSEIKSIKFSFTS